MNPDFGLILHFDSKQNPDDVVKLARNIGARAVSFDQVTPEVEAALDKYTIKLADQSGVDLPEDPVDLMVKNRLAGKATCFNIPTANGQIEQTTKAKLEQINEWIHLFGHAFNESTNSELTVDGDGYIMENRHMAYQKYVYLHTPFPKSIVVKGLDQAPNRVELIDQRVELDFKFDQDLTIELPEIATPFAWIIVRIQAHREEDDWEETKF